MDHAAPPPDVQLRQLTKRFDGTTAVDGIDLDVPPGAFVTFLGSSGCGKTTTLRMIGGFEHPDSGEIRIQGTPVGTTPPHARDTSMVFQSYALFPHMSVKDNVAFGLRERRMSRSHIAEKVDRMLDLVELRHLADRKPRQLSGGQQQRVALARSLVIEPAVLLLDEPLGALDLQLRKQMQLELKRIQQQVGITFIYVTHDQEEALTMSDRIVVMRHGHIEQDGTAEEIFARPATQFVAQFMGAQNVLPATVEAHDASSTRLRIGGVSVTVPGVAPAGNVAAVIRPEHLRLSSGGGWQGIVRDAVFKGSAMAYIVALPDGTTLHTDIPHDVSERRLRPGDAVTLVADPAAIVLVPAETPQARA